MNALLYFKRVLLSLCLILATISISNAQSITVNCQVFQQNYGTGSCSATAKSTTSDIQAYSGGGLRGWAKFDVSSIPDNATINSVKIHYCIGNHNWPYYVITKLNADPITTAAPNIFSTIGQASSDTNNLNTYFEYSGVDTSGWQIKPLNIHARNDLQNSLQQNWFSVGVMEYEGGGTTYFLWAFGWDNGARPYLEVNYSVSNLTNDLGLTSIVSPPTPFCPGNLPVKVVLANFGTNVVYTAHISWTVNNGAVTTYMYNNTAGLAPGAHDTVNVGSHNFVQGDTLVNAGVSMPNGNTDPNTSNNYASKAIHINYSSYVYSPMNQTVTVGGGTSFSAYVYYWSNQSWHWQVSMDGGQTYIDLTNNNIYSQVDSTVLLVQNIPLSMNGYLFRCRVGTQCGFVYTNSALLTVGSGQLAINQIYANPDTLCSNSSTGTQLHVVAVGGTGNYTYNWTSMPAGFISTLANPTFTVTQTTHFFCTVSDGVNTVSGSCLVVVNVAPGQAGIISGPSSVCKGSTITMTVPPITGATYYYWTVPSGFTFSNNGNTITLTVGSTAVSGNITVRGYNSCGTGPVSTKAVTVNPSLYANAGPDQTVYPGATVTLTASASGGTAPYTYLWSNGMTGATIQVTPTSTTTYILTVTDASGCTAIDYVVIHISTAINLVTYIQNTSNCSGVINIPILVNNFNNVASISLKLFFNTSHLTYTGYNNVNTSLSSGTMLVNASGNAIQIAWFSITPATITNYGTLLNLQFQADTGYSAFTWDLVTQGACQYTNINNVTIPAVFYNGSTTVQTCSNVSGHAWYNNNNHTAMSLTPVKLLQNGVIIYQTTTDSTGHYAFSSLATGTYQSVVQPTKPWGGVNASDALLILKHFVNMVTLTGVSLQAADVDLSSSVNSVDALMVAKRFVNMITSFPAGNWTSIGTTFTINGTANVNDSIMALCTGDVDRSYLPPFAKIAPSVRISEITKSAISENQMIDIPLFVENSIEIGSVSMVMDFQSDYLTLTNVKAAKDGYQVYTYDGKQIRYAWFNIEPMILNAGDVFLHLICKTTAQDGSLELNADKDFEISDANGLSIPDVGITYARPVVNESSSFLGQNIPNPFATYTDIPYLISEKANVQIAIYDYTGKLVQQLTNNQEDKGSYTVRFNRDGLAPGIYVCRLTVTTGSMVSCYNQRMVIK